MSWCAQSLAVSVSIAAAAISEGKTPEQLAVLAAAFTQLGDPLTTIAIFQSECEGKGESEILEATPP